MCFIRELHRRSRPHDDLIDEQSLAFVTAIIRAAVGHDKNTDDKEDAPPRSGSISWPLLTEALFKRGFYERRSLARTERALRQLEELTQQFLGSSPDTEFRGLEHFFCSRMPAYWQIELSHAKLLTKIGSSKSALDIYLRWQQWDDIIASYTSLGKRDLVSNSGLFLSLTCSRSYSTIASILGGKGDPRTHCRRS